MSTPFLRRTTVRLSRRASSMTRGSRSYFLAHAVESDEGLIVDKSTREPSDLETILCLTTRISPASKESLDRRRACISLSTRESPGEMSSARAIGISLISLDANIGLRFRLG